MLTLPNVLALVCCSRIIWDYNFLNAVDGIVVYRGNIMFSYFEFKYTLFVRRGN